MHNYKVGAFYGGYGSALLGASWGDYEEHYFEPIFLCEPRKEFSAENTIENFPNLKICSSPVDVDIRQADLVWGSPPCAQFSTLGVKRDDFGKLDRINPAEFDYYKFLNVMAINQVPVFVLENVPRVLKYFSFEDDFVLFCGRRCLQMAGYKFQVVEIDANTCGVPQHRKRAYVIGSRLFQPEAKDPYYYGSHMNPLDPIVDAHYVGKVVSDVLPLKHTQSELPRHSEIRKKGFSGLKPGQSYYGTQNNRRLFWDKPSFTITSHCTRHVHPEESRVLSAKECAKIMGYPDSFKFSGGESKKLDQIGKAIVPQVAWLISNYIHYELQRAHHKSRYL